MSKSEFCSSLSSYGFRFGDTIVPWRKAVCNSGFKQKQESQELHSKGCAAQRGRDAFGTATRISASLSRRLSAFFGSTHDQAPKAAKFAVLNPGHAGFPKRVERSEGSDTTPVRNTPVSACEPLCAIFLREPSVYPLLPVKANVGRLCERLKNAMKSGLGRSCSGNFLAIVAGTILSEKLNLTGGFFEWRRPFDFSTR